MFWRIFDLFINWRVKLTQLLVITHWLTEKTWFLFDWKWLQNYFQSVNHGVRHLVVIIKANMTIIDCEHETVVMVCRDEGDWKPSETICSVWDTLSSRDEAEGTFWKSGEAKTASSSAACMGGFVHVGQEKTKCFKNKFMQSFDQMNFC